MPSNPNHRTGLLLTRPEPLARPLAQKIQQAGGKVWVIPALTIEPIIIPPAIIQDLIHQTRWVIFISASAIQLGWPIIQRDLPPDSQLVTIGQPSAERLHKLSGRSVLHPTESQDSEALLKLDWVHHIEGQKILIIKGEGGRPWLKDQLQQRGAIVSELMCYRRLTPQITLKDLQDVLAHHPLINVQSNQTLNHLWDLSGPTLQPQLVQEKLVVHHHRIEQQAKALGFQKIIVIEPGDAALFNLWQNG
ncbi:MAG: uroporphyrinogen-III synthase [Ferrovum sp.]|nr:uroporphyrinogen-III synthase [Ferrovum sp.]